MKILISLSTEKPLTLSIDNPGGTWLKEEQEYCQSKGLNRYGSPARFGAVTGTWNRHVLLPVDVLAKLHGVNGEQDNVRPASLKSLVDHMGATKRLPLIDEDSDRHYAPFVVVYLDGTPYVNEGNHRIMAAKKLGFKYLPVELRYFSGGEEAKGILSPNKVKTFDGGAHKLGYTLTDYAK